MVLQVQQKEPTRVTYLQCMKIELQIEIIINDEMRKYN